MRALLITAAATVTLVGLAGCGQDVDPARGQAPRTTSPTPAEAPSVTPPPTKSPELPVDPTKAPAPPRAPVSISPTGPVVPPGVTQVPAAQVDVSAVPDYYDHRGLVFVYDDGRSLQAFAMASSGCGEAEARLTEQTATDVRIELRALAQAQGGSPDSTMCTTVLTPRPVTVTLEAPLGDRTVHLSAGR